ncbi:GGDEF domain-containing protein [Azohydromonas aeria]|uniref:GGDEF domain-containing protein n=1 Tax=Azohydromonas aeria TaxID=2590212 RepID=UPI0012F77D31|nr:GGDEF domain-containing protein [Azohydromonas aeria]
MNAIPGPALDPLTLLFSLGALGLLMAALFLRLARTLPRHRGALAAWSRAMAAAGAAFLLFFLRGHAPLVLTFLLANMLIFGVAYWGHEAHARLLDAPPQRGWSLAWCAVGIGGVLAAQGLGLPRQVAFVTISVGFSAILGMTTWLLLRAAGGRRRSPSMLAALLCYGMLSVAFGARAVLGLLGSEAQLHPGAVSLAQLFTLVPGTVLIVACSISFLCMVHEHQLREVEDDARRDGLTGLHNRAALMQLAARIDAEKGAARAPYAVVMIDIDHFKAINDAYGHGGGDAVLVHAGRLIAGSARLADFVCRWGGEEFCVLLHGCDAAEAAAFARRVVEEGGTQVVRLPGGELATFTLSAGYATHPGHGAQSVAGVIARADAALYAAKRAGRNQAMGETQALAS